MCLLCVGAQQSLTSSARPLSCCLCLLAEKNIRLISSNEFSFSVKIPNLEAGHRKTSQI